MRKKKREEGKKNKDTVQKIASPYKMQSTWTLHINTQTYMYNVPTHKPTFAHVWASSRLSAHLCSWMSADVLNSLRTRKNTNGESSSLCCNHEYTHTDIPMAKLMSS